MRNRPARKLKILVINPFGIGDVLFSTPLVAALRESYPESRICYICNKRAHDVLRSNPNIDRIFVYEKDDFRAEWERSRIAGARMIWRFLRTIKAERFDIGIDLSLNHQTPLLMRITGVRRRFGLNYRERGRFLTGKIPIAGFNDKHVIEYYLDILKLLDIDPAGFQARPRVYLTDSDRSWGRGFLRSNGAREGDLLVGIIPGCGASWGKDAGRRRWAAEGFASVADALAGRYGARIVLFGDVKETALCERVQALMKHRAIMACGRTTVADFLGLVSLCDLVITNDGGPLHMAVAAGVDTVSIFGPVDELIYGPYPPSARHSVVSKKGMACRPCYRRFKYTPCEERACLTGISSEEVLAAAESHLTKRPKKRDECTADICRDR